MKKRLIISICLMILVLFGSSYAWFNYTEKSSDSKVITGNIYMLLEDDEDTINLVNTFPQSKEQARSRNDNYVSFKIYGLNESNDNVHYEISLLNGDTENNLERFNDKDLVFDLVEIGENDEETYLLDAVSFDTLNNRKIWIDTIRKNTNSEVEKEYRLRMWLSDSVLISDSDANRDYYATGEHAFSKHYASIKVAVNADISEKSLPSSTTTRDTYIENGKSYFITHLSNDYLLEEEGELLDSNDTITLEITNPDNLLYFSYIDSKGNEDTANNESLRLTYTYNKNETVNIKVFTISRNDSNVSTTLHFKVTKNGNIVQEYNKQIDVIGNNYCLNNGFTKLSDCILVTENLAKNVNSAKTYINSKGSPNVSQTAPTYEYVEQVTLNEDYTGSDGYPNWSSGEKYVFNSTTGTFALKKADGTTNASSYIALSNDLVGTYTCGTSQAGYTICETIYKVTSVDMANNKITGTKITYKVNSSMDSQVGLYKVVDTDGDSYIYRGAVSNNNVYFGGYYWKVLRINGDGSIRLIFNGNALASDGNKTAGGNVAISATRATGINAIYPFNSSPGGPTYAGYMTTESNDYWTTGTFTAYTNIVENTPYYFADDYETYTDTYGNRQFKLKGNVYQSKLKDLTASQIEAHPYTCSGTSANLICTRLVKIDSVINNTRFNGYYITYSPNYEANPSLTKADVEKNENDSTAKKQLDLWYQNKFQANLNNGKAITSYLADNHFCNDRTITETGDYNSGYLLTATTYYAPRTRLSDASDLNKSATLLCNKNDNFSVTEKLNTNGKLDYPIGLITADEIALAGGKYEERNENFWLMTNGGYWTMTPSHYASTSARARMFYVLSNGAIGDTGANGNSGLRAVINLKADTTIMQGDGTPSNPYIIE